jgi:Flp pilus assembly protein TadG
MNILKKVHKNECGAATVEFALSLPVVITFFLFVVLVGSFEIEQLECQNASTVAARILALGKPEQEAIDVAHKIGGNNLTINISNNNNLVTVQIEKPFLFINFGQKIIKTESTLYKEPESS